MKIQRHAGKCQRTLQTHLVRWIIVFLMQQCQIISLWFLTEFLNELIPCFVQILLQAAKTVQVKKVNKFAWRVTAELQASVLSSEAGIVTYPHHVASVVEHFQAGLPDSKQSCGIVKVPAVLLRLHATSHNTQAHAEAQKAQNNALSDTSRRQDVAAPRQRTAVLP